MMTFSLYGFGSVYSLYRLPYRRLKMLEANMRDKEVVDLIRRRLDVRST